MDIHQTTTTKKQHLYFSSIVWFFFSFFGFLSYPFTISPAVGFLSLFQYPHYDGSSNTDTMSTSILLVNNEVIC